LQLEQCETVVTFILTDTFFSLSRWEREQRPLAQKTVRQIHVDVALAFSKKLVNHIGDIKYFIYHDNLSSSLGYRSKSSSKPCKISFVADQFKCIIRK